MVITLDLGSANFFRHVHKFLYEILGCADLAWLVTIGTLLAPSNHYVTYTCVTLGMLHLIRWIWMKPFQAWLDRDMDEARKQRLGR